MRPAKPVLVTVAIAVALGLGACGRQPGGHAGAQPAAGPPDGPGVSTAEAQSVNHAAQWTDGYCGAMGEFVEALAHIPRVDPSSPQRATDSSSRLLGAVTVGLDRTVNDLDRLGPSPVPGGDDVRGRAVGTFTSIRDRVRGAKTQLDSAPEGSPQSHQALGAAAGPLQEISKINLLDGFNAIPALASATSQAPKCRQLTSQSAPPPAQPPR